MRTASYESIDVPKMNEANLWDRYDPELSVRLRRSLNPSPVVSPHKRAYEHELADHVSISLELKSVEYVRISKQS